MAQVLLTYDVSQRHSEVKAALRKKSFYDYWTDNDVKYHLPNTTMWKKGDTITELTVLNDMKAVIADLNRGEPSNRTIILERCVSVVFASWAAIPGEPHKS